LLDVDRRAPGQKNGGAQRVSRHAAARGAGEGAVPVGSVASGRLLQVRLWAVACDLWGAPAAYGF